MILVANWDTKVIKKQNFILQKHQYIKAKWQKKNFYSTLWRTRQKMWRNICIVTTEWEYPFGIMAAPLWNWHFVINLKNH